MLSRVASKWSYGTLTDQFTPPRFGPQGYIYVGFLYKLWGELLGLYFILACFPPDRQPGRGIAIARVRPALP